MSHQRQNESSFYAKETNCTTLWRSSTRARNPEDNVSFVYNGGMNSLACYASCLFEKCHKLDFKNIFYNFLREKILVRDVIFPHLFARFLSQVFIFEGIYLFLRKLGVHSKFSTHMIPPRPLKARIRYLRDEQLVSFHLLPADEPSLYPFRPVDARLQGPLPREIGLWGLVESSPTLYTSATYANPFETM